MADAGASSDGRNANKTRGVEDETGTKHVTTAGAKWLSWVVVISMILSTSAGMLSLFSWLPDLPVLSKLLAPLGVITDDSGWARRTAAAVLGAILGYFFGRMTMESAE